MRTINVKLKGYFKDFFNEKAPRGTPVVIDKVGANKSSRTGLMVRIVNIWKKPQWFDSEWFKFEEG